MFHWSRACGLHLWILRIAHGITNIGRIFHGLDRILGQYYIEIIGVATTASNE